MGRAHNFLGTSFCILVIYVCHKFHVLSTHADSRGFGDAQGVLIAEFPGPVPVHLVLAILVLARDLYATVEPHRKAA